MNAHPKAANSFKYFLSLIMLLLVTFIALGFYYEQNALREFAQSISNNNKSTANNLDKPSSNLNNNEINKINSVYFPKTNYQNLVKKDINDYADKSNIKISEFVFSNTNQATDRNELQIETVELKIQDSIVYNDLLQLLKYIENSLPKMQVISLNLEKNSSNSDIVVQEFKIEVYF